MVNKKPTAKMSHAELEMQELFELLKEVRQELQDIKTMADDLYFKAQISHSLLVVRKISEDKLDKFNELLD